MNQLLWRPSPERVAASTMTRFIEFVAERTGRDIHDYPSLYRWSVEASDVFWPSVWEFFGIHAKRQWNNVLTDGDRMPGARWFGGAELNFAENLLRYNDDQAALIFRDEAGQRMEISYRELRRRVAQTAAALKAEGIGPGDRVAAFMPNHPETVVAMLAATSLGAVWSSCSPDFGTHGVLDRFGQIEPKVLFAIDGYHYAGKKIDSLPRLRRVADGLRTLQRIVIVPFLNTQPDLNGLRHTVLIEEFRGHSDATLEFAALSFDHPVYIMYSSGTTGKPKCIVHGAGGTLLQHLKELGLHTDVRRNDRIFYFTTCGWMMWNWLVSALGLGATVILYDGSPFHPDPGILWRMAEQEGVTIFGTSAKYISALEKSGLRPGHEYDLDALRTILSTGSPLAPESFDFVYREIKNDLLLSSISGGTDIVSCFALGNPTLPVYRGELQCRGLGMSVEVFDTDGRSVREQKGELVCTRPFPSMPVGFWNDPHGRRYRKAYFERFPDVWCHGDYAELTNHDGLVIHGRSDAVLNPGGVRIGTAEIYRQVEKLDEVSESIAIGQDWQDDVRVILFVRLREDTELDEVLQDRIRRVIRENTTPRHVPAKILAVPDIPRTISGKIVELAVRKVVHDQPVDNTDALANPEALEHFRNRAELQTD